jgi:hypothetical protein
MENINEIELFDKYLHHELSSNEKLEFKKKINTNPNFKQEFELHKLLIQGIKSTGASDLKNELNNLHDDREKSLKKRFGFYIFLSSLAIVGLWLATLENKEQVPLEVKHHQKIASTQLTRTKKIAVTTKADALVGLDHSIKQEQQTTSPNKIEAIEKEESNTFFPLKEVGPKMIYLAEFVEKPQYMYFKNTVHLVGWKGLTANKIDLRIKKNKLYLFLNNSYFEIEETSTWLNAPKVKDSRNFGTLQYGTGKAKKIRILIHPMKIKRSSKRLNLFTTDSLPNTKWYQLKKQQLTLSNKGNKCLKKGKLVEYKSELYLKISTKIFLINADGKSQTFKLTSISDWEEKRITEHYMKPKYLNFEDQQNLEQSN